MKRGSRAHVQWRTMNIIKNQWISLLIAMNLIKNFITISVYSYSYLKRSSATLETVSKLEVSESWAWGLKKSKGK